MTACRTAQALAASLAPTRGQANDGTLLLPTRAMVCWQLEERLGVADLRGSVVRC